MSKSQGRRVSSIIFVVLLVAGLSLLLYPTISNTWNSFHQSQAITEYTEEVSEMSTEQYEQLWAAAQTYNEELTQNPDRFLMTSLERAKYEDLLDPSDTGMMGYLEIPKLNVEMPIYHGTSEGVLQVGAGHLEGTSLPTGGKGTHCALSGHRGLPSAELFTDIDKLENGDLFTLKVLDRTLVYEVDQILTVDPYDMEALAIDPQQDYCTLVTCTPYGINSHRLLVRGHRVTDVEAPEMEHEQQASSPLWVLAGAGALALVAGITLRFVLRRTKQEDNA